MLGGLFDLTKSTPSPVCGTPNTTSQKQFVPKSADASTPCSVDDTGAIALAQQLADEYPSPVSAAEPIHFSQRNDPSSIQCFAECVILAEQFHPLECKVDVIDSKRWAIVRRKSYDLLPSEGGPLNFLFLVFSEDLKLRFRILHNMLVDCEFTVTDFQRMVHQRLNELSDNAYVVCRGFSAGDDSAFQPETNAIRNKNCERCMIFPGRFRSSTCILWFRKDRSQRCANCQDHVKRYQRLVRNQRQGLHQDVTVSSINFRYLQDGR